MAKQWGVDFKDLEFYTQKFEKLSNKNNLKSTADKALKETHNLLTPKIESQFEKHNRSGLTIKSLRKDNSTEWHGDIGSVDVGFDLKNGGLPSIFLMYGTPRMKPDKELYNLFYGSKIKREVFKMQENIFNDELQKIL